MLNEKEKTTIMDLQTQEQACIQKYDKYSKEAKDPVLKELFCRLKENEQKHFKCLSQILRGEIISCDCNDNEGRNYEPKATYSKGDNSDDKNSDCFLATDCIGSEKLVSTEYNSNVFNFANAAIRKLLADIQIEEQNHAQMLWKYKTVNGMA